MREGVGRRRVAVAYTWLMGIATFEVILQGFLFSGFYARGQVGFLDTHGVAGELTGYVVTVVLIPLGFLARFPRSLGVGWWTVLLAVLWNLQAHLLGYGIEDVRWFEMLHIPVAFGVLLLALYLTVRAWGALGADQRSSA